MVRSARTHQGMESKCWVGLPDHVLLSCDGYIMTRQHNVHPLKLLFALMEDRDMSVKNLFYVVRVYLEQVQMENMDIYLLVKGDRMIGAPLSSLFS